MSIDYNWHRGVELYNDYVKKRLIWIGAVMLAVGIISVVVTGGATTLFLLSYSIGLASTLNTFISENLGLSLKNAPRAYLALVMLKPTAPKDMKSLYETLNKVEELDKEGAEYLKTIANVPSIISASRSFAQWGTVATLMFASKAGVLESAVKAIGEEKVVKFITFFVTGNKDTAKSFLQALEKWGFSTDLYEKLDAIRNIENILGGLIVEQAVSAGLKYLGKYLALEAQKTQDGLMGFFGLHCLLLGDLYKGLITLGPKLEFSYVAPTVDNVLTFYNYKIIYYDLRDELFEGLEKYNLEDLYDTGVLSFFIPLPRKARSVRDWGAILSKVQETWKNLIDREKGKCGEVAKEAIAVLGEAVDAFEKFRNDMASRRKAPGPALGLDLVLVMDVSGSMADRFRGERKIDAAIRAASDFTKLVSPYDRVALVKFSSQEC
jgi:hypothetical protein